MPTYEYLCPDCGVVEALQSMRDAPLTTCPTCGKAKVTRLVSGGAGVIFKGSGFWETDYNRGKDYTSRAKQDAGGDKPKAPEAAKGGDAGKEAKPAAPQPKPEPKPQPKPAPAPAPSSSPKPGGKP